MGYDSKSWDSKDKGCEGRVRRVRVRRVRVRKTRALKVVVQHGYGEKRRRENGYEQKTATVSNGYGKQW